MQLFGVVLLFVCFPIAEARAHYGKGLEIGLGVGGGALVLVAVW